MRKYLFFILIIFLSSCTSPLDRKLIGIWTIDIDSLETTNPIWLDVLGNGLVLNDNHTALLPGFFNIDVNYMDDITWESISEEKSNTICFQTSPDHPMSGKFKITFYRDYKEKLFKMKLENDNTVIICRKALQNFGRDNPNW